MLSKKNEGALFYEQSDKAIWDFVREKTRRELRNLQIVQGNLWSKYIISNNVCTIIVMPFSEGLLITCFTDMNPTIRELDYYTRQDDDDYESVIKDFIAFLTDIWQDSLSHERRTRLFGIRWPKMPDFTKYKKT